MVPSDALNAAVAAYYKAKLENAVLAIEAIPYDGSDLPEIIRKIKHESETGRVLILSSLVEDRIEQLISQNMCHLTSSAARERMFTGNGPLSTFGNRLVICYHLGWISESTFKQISCIRKIRNEFAHNAYKVDFESISVRKFFPEILETITEFEINVFPILIREKENSNFKRPSDLNTADQFLCATILCIGTLLQELITYPTSTREKINPNDFRKMLGRSPTNITSVVRNMLIAVATILND